MVRLQVAPDRAGNILPAVKTLMKCRSALRNLNRARSVDQLCRQRSVFIARMAQVPVSSWISGSS
jgi:hypothetical protein